MAKEKILLALEIITLIISFIIILTGLLQPKKTEAGLGALSGGNQELFTQTKERGFARTLSFVMFGSGIFLFVIAIIIRILQNVL